jgi:membrane-associated phospholipid phosphatase
MEIIWLALFYLYTVVGYFYFSHKPNDYHFISAWDKYVPTVPIFLIPYFFATIAFLAVPIIFYLKLDWAKTKAYLIAQTIAGTISYLVFTLFPTSVVRETITGKGFFYDWLRWLHTNDRPSAAFPSGHVFNTIIIGYFCWIYFPKTRPYVLVIVPLVIAATVLLKQHYLPDIPGGIVVAVIAIMATKSLKLV